MTRLTADDIAQRVRRRAGAARRQVWQALQHVDPIRLTLPTTAPDLRIAVVCVYRTKNAGIVRRNLYDLPASATVRLWSLDAEIPADLDRLTLGTGPGSRFQLLNRLIAETPEERRRDGLVLMDDDVAFVVGDVGRLVTAARWSSFDVYQPGHSARSYANWSFVRRRALTFARRTDFVEQGPVVGLSSRAQEVLLALPEDLGMAWGVEVRWWVAALHHGLLQGIIDVVAVQHLTPTAQDYNRGAHELTLDRELHRVGVTDIRVLQRTVSRTRLAPGRLVQPPRRTPSQRAPDGLSRDVEPCVSVVVPTRHRRDQVLAVVDSVRDDPAVLEIIVVVDGGGDDTFAALTAIADAIPNLQPILQEHAGAGAARQNGLERAKGDVVLLLDDDVLPSPGLASGHLEAHRQDPGRVVVGALPPERPGGRTAHSVVEKLYADDYDICCRDYERDPDTVLAHLWSGNLSLDRRQALAVGVGDPDFDKLFFEDRDFGLRLRAAGIDAVFRPDLCAVHEHVGRLGGYLRDSVRQGEGLALLCLRYPDEVPEPTARYLSGRFPSPIRWLLLAAQRKPYSVGCALTRSLLVVSYIAGWLRLWAVQHVLVVLLRRAGQAMGVGVARRSRHVAGVAISV